MAIIFSSSKKQQWELFWSIILFLVFMIAVVLFIAFSPRIGGTTLNKEDIVLPNINFDVLHSEAVENLEPFLP